MKIKYNQQEFEFQTPPTVNQFLVETLTLKTEGIAVAINSSVVPRSEWETALIYENDNLMIIKATQGG